MAFLILQQPAVSFGLGLLLGLERERRGSSIRGIRTFPIISLFGTVSAQLGQVFRGWIVAVGLVALAAIIISSNFAQIKAGAVDPGMTTEIAALLLYSVGALIVIGYLSRGSYRRRDGIADMLKEAAAVLRERLASATCVPLCNSFC